MPRIYMKMERQLAAYYGFELIPWNNIRGSLFKTLLHTQMHTHIYTQINIWIFYQLWDRDVNRIKKSPNHYIYLVQQSGKAECVVGPIYRFSTSSGTKKKGLLCGDFLPMQSFSQRWEWFYNRPYKTWFYQQVWEPQADTELINWLVSLYLLQSWGIGWWWWKAYVSLHF